MANKRNEIVNVTLASASAGVEKALEWNGNDDHMILVINNTGSAATTIVIKAGDSIQGVNDLTLNVATGISLVKLESGRFKNVTGTNKGKIVVRPTAALNVAVAKLV